MTLSDDALIVALILSMLLGLAIGIIGSAAYANRRLQRILAGLDQNGTILQQLAHERAIFINQIVDLQAEMTSLHASAGGLLRRLGDLRRDMDASINDTTPLSALRELRFKAPERKASSDWEGR